MGGGADKAKENTLSISLLVNGKPLTLLGGKWQITSGVNPYIGYFSVDKNISADNLGGKECELEFKKLEKPIKFEKLWIVDDINLTGGFRQLVIADKRYLWQFKKIYKSKNKEMPFFNLTRQTGRVTTFSSWTDSGVVEERYKKFSVIGGTYPYSIFAIVKEILTYYLEEKDVIMDCKDLDDIYDNIVSEAVDPGSFLSEIMPKAHLNLHVTQDGKIRVYNMKDEIENVSFDGSILEGKSLESLWHGLRPGKLKMLSIKEQEIALNNNPTSKTRIINVLPLPYATKNAGTGSYGSNVNILPTIAGEEYLRGEFVPLEDFVEALGVNYAAMERRFARPLGLEALFMADFIVKSITGTAATDKELAQRAIFNTVKGAFRMIWKIPQNEGSKTKLDLDKILEINPYRVQVEATKYGDRKPAEVYCDWSELYECKQYDKSGKEKTKASANHPMELAPLEVSIPNKDLGIIILSWKSDLMHFAKQKFMGTLKKDLSWATYGNVSLWDNIEMDAGFSIIIILSIVRIDDLYWETDGTLDLEGNKDITLTILNTRERARFDYQSKFINKSLIDGIFETEKQDINRSWGKHLQGLLSVEFTDKLTKLSGNMEFIEWEISEKTAKTTFSAVKVPSLPSTYSEMNPLVRQLVFKSLGKSGV